MEVSFHPSAPDRVAVKADFRLKNAGLPAIENLEVRLPDPATFDLENVKAQWIGHGSTDTPIADEKDRYRFAFGAAFKSKASGEFELSYGLKLPAIILPNNQAAFFLPSFGWYPLLLAAEGPLGSGGAWPKKWELDITVPESYSVHASGRSAGRRRRNGEVEWRFVQVSNTYLPFAVAGNYSTREFRVGRSTVELWSIAPVNDDRARGLANRLASDDQYFAAQFGASPKAASQLWIIECPDAVMARADGPWLAVRGCMTVPDAAVVPAGFLSGAGNESDTAMLHSVDMQLAASRFYFVARIDRNGPLYPLAAANDYAVFALEASRNAGSRDPAVRELVSRLAEVPAADQEKALGSVRREDPIQVRDAAHLRSELFYIALEDRCSSQSLHRALARIFRVMQGGAWSLNELRSAVEAECNSDLAQFFHDWLDHPGIPDAFRQKYSQPAAAHD